MSDDLMTRPGTEADVAAGTSAVALEEHDMFGDALVRFKIPIVALFIAAALVSAFPLREMFSSPDTYQQTIQVLDEKKGNVMAMVAASTAASAGISAIPDDVGTPIANKLMDLSGNLMIILAVIYLEKYLLTILGAASFGLLFPAACILVAIAVLSFRRSSASAVLGRIALKVAVIGVVLVIAVPTSAWVTQTIDNTYEITIGTQDEAAEAPQEEEEQSTNPLDFIISIPGRIADGVTSVTDDVLQQVNNLIEGAAVMIVTSCLIPVLVLAFYLWMANILLGINIEAPKRALMSRAQKMKVTRGDVDEFKSRLRAGKGGRS